MKTANKWLRAQVRPDTCASSTRRLQMRSTLLAWTSGLFAASFSRSAVCMGWEGRARRVTWVQYIETRK